MHAARRLRRLSFLIVAAATLGMAASRVEASGLGVRADTIPTIPDSLRGRSGQLRVALVPLPESATVSASPAVRAARGPAIWSVADRESGGLFHFIELLPFSEKRDGRVGAYTVGRFPGERRGTRHPQWGLPSGFVSVTPELLSLAISTHLTLGDFVSLRDQRDVWPRPLVLDLRLVDKLELVLAALRDAGHRDPRFHVMSGFRTPSVTMRNARTAQAPDSRHQYGDAADVIVDADGDGRMDDLTKDGRVDVADARYLVRIVLAVEEAHPDLVGGIGLYRGGGRSGPFVHIDARGERARWGLP